MGAAKIVPKDHLGAVYFLHIAAQDMEEQLKQWMKSNQVPPSLLDALDASIQSTYETIALLEGQRSIKVDETTEDLARRITTGPRWDACSPQIAKRFAEVVMEVLD